MSLDIEMRCKRNLGVVRLEKVFLYIFIYIYIFISIYIYIYFCLYIYIYKHPGGRSRRLNSHIL